MSKVSIRTDINYMLSAWDTFVLALRMILNADNQPCFPNARALSYNSI